MRKGVRRITLTQGRLMWRNNSVEKESSCILANVLIINVSNVSLKHDSVSSVSKQKAFYLFYGAALVLGLQSNLT